MSYDKAIRAGPPAEIVERILAPSQPWDVAYAELEPLVRNILVAWDLPEDKGTSTDALARTLYQKFPTPQLKQRIFRALFALAQHGLADCATRGAPMWNRGIAKRPWLWHRPIEGRPGSTLPPGEVKEPTWEAFKDTILGRLASLETRVDAMEGTSHG